MLVVLHIRNYDRSIGAPLAGNHAIQYGNSLSDIDYGSAGRSTAPICRSGQPPNRVREYGPSRAQTRGTVMLDLGEADMQAETAQHPDEPEGGQQSPHDDATHGDGGSEQFNHLR
jgi:hypothetical protein